MNNFNKPHGELGIIALQSCKEIGREVDEYVKSIRKDSDETTYLIKADEVRFANGEGKVKIRETVRGKDIYILCDIGNYSCTYDIFGFTNHMTPDEHFQDIKRVVSAISGKANRVSVIMPLLYESRQHRRKGRESLDCALALQELERIGVDEVITFDAHDPNVQNAIPLQSFENIYPTYDIIKAFVKGESDVEIDKSKMIVISPDTGAMDRAIYYSTMLKLDIGLFYKRRDYSKVIGGKNPIVQHEYIGRDVEGQDIFIVDDMIASGESMLDIAIELKKRGARRVYAAVTFAFFTEGIEKFERCYREGIINRVYATNLTYIPDEVVNAEWFRKVDMSEFVATIVNTLNQDESMSPHMDATQNIQKLFEENGK